MTFLAIIQDASDEIGLPRPVSAISSSDTQVRQLVRQAQREGQMLARRHNWTALITEATHTTVATELQGVMTTIAPGFKWMVNNTQWNRSQQEAIGGPLTAPDWQILQSATITGPYYDYRIQNGNLFLYPAPTAGDTIAFEFMSANWCQSSTGTGQIKWLNDTDTGVIDEELMTLGTVVRYKKAKGLGYAEDLRDYEIEVNNAIARDGGRRILKLDETYSNREPEIRAPVGSWNL